MDVALTVFRLLPWHDWAALSTFFCGWVGYALFARKQAGIKPSILAATNRIRRQWMLQTTYREVRVIDGVVVQSLSTSPSFFASTTILIIGGLLAVLGSSNASELVREIPFAARTTVLVFDLKIVLMLAIFVYAFFRFTWSMRQYSFGALLIGAAPSAAEFAAAPDAGFRQRYADRAGRVMALAAETFNNGLRAVYFSFAAILWFLSPVALVAGTAVVVWVLYRREFHSEVVKLLNEQV